MAIFNPSPGAGFAFVGKVASQRLNGPARRVASASVAAWTRIGISVTAQVVTVPLFLTHWPAATFGAWLLFQAGGVLLNVPDAGHQAFVGGEFLRIGGDSPKDLRRVYSAAVPVAIVIAMVQVAVVAGLLLSGRMSAFFEIAGYSDAEALEHSAAIGSALLVQSCLWMAMGAWTGVTIRLLSSLGYFARFAWWGVLYAICTAFVPALAAYEGASLFVACISVAVVGFLYNVVLVVDLVRLLKKEGLAPQRPHLWLGLLNAARSLSLTVHALLEIVRQQGLRIALAPVAGIEQVAAFAAMRTGSNFVLQGLSTVTQPLLPELMAFLRARDHQRSNAALALIWFLVIVLLAPAVICLQLVGPRAFQLWTNGKVAWDAPLFAELSIAVLFYALAQPALAVLQGNNLARVQLVLSSLTTFLCVGGLLALVPLLGIRGAGAAVLGSELIFFIGASCAAIRWMSASGNRWPFQINAVALTSVVFAAACATLIAWAPAFGVTIMLAMICVSALLARLFWFHVPEVAKAGSRTLIAKVLRRPFQSR